MFALERPTEPLLCRTDPALTCDSKRDDLCCECCNFGTLSYAAAKEIGCEVNKAAFAGDCQVVFEECCYGRGNHLLIPDTHAELFWGGSDWHGVHVRPIPPLSQVMGIMIAKSDL